MLDQESAVSSGEDLTTLLAWCAMDGLGDGDMKWPSNSISCLARFDFTNGIFQDDQDSIKPISDEEVSLCRRLAVEARDVYGPGDIQISSESSCGFAPFWLVTTAAEKEIPKKITGDLIRSRFNGTLMPLLNVSVEALGNKEGEWYQALVEKAIDEFEIDEEEEEDEDEDEEEEDEDEEKEEDEDEETQKPEKTPKDHCYQEWKDTIAWFTSRQEFVDTAFVETLHNDDLWGMDDDDKPEGVEMLPAACPIFVFGLTEKGSLVGMFSYVVHT